MAKVVDSFTYNIKLGDRVIFKVKTWDGKRTRYLEGTVECISTLPDTIWVETGRPDIKWNGDEYDIIGYRRWEITLKQIDFTDDRTESSVIEVHEAEFKENEDLEFVYEKDYKTQKVTNKYNNKLHGN